MMQRTKDRVQLTLKEAETVAELLYTLESMGGAADDEENPEPEFDRDCKKAGNLANKIWALLWK